MFTARRRQWVSDRLLDRARADERVVGAARTGSAARGTEDEWSDVDLFFGVGPDGQVADVLAEWSSWVYAGLGAVHHFDLHAGPATYRAFLLADGLEVDLGLAPADSFGPLGGGAFDVVFGEAVEARSDRVDTDHLIGLSWHHALHAQVAIARGQPWQAEHWISAPRDHTMTLACVRLGVPAHHGGGAGHLPAGVLDSLAAALVTCLDAAELTRALGAAVEAFVTEVHVTDPAAAVRLQHVLQHLVDTPR